MIDKLSTITKSQLNNAQAKITYLGEQEKPIPTVVFVTASIKLTKLILTDSKLNNFPESVVSSLETLIDQEYNSRGEFVKVLEKTIGKSETVKYGSLIMESSFFIENNTLLINDFVSIQHDPEPYGNDKLPYTKKTVVTPNELSRMLTVIQPIIKEENEIKKPNFLSFSLIYKTKESDIEGFELSIEYDTGKIFFQELIKALHSENVEGYRILNEQFNNIYTGY